jgi:hypothetical protein
MLDLLELWTGIERLFTEIAKACRQGRASGVEVDISKPAVQVSLVGAVVAVVIIVNLVFPKYAAVETQAESRKEQ